MFREIFREPEEASGLVASALPAEVASAFDWASMTGIGGSFVDGDLTQCHADLLFRVDTAGGAPVLIYLLLEHKSQPDPDTVFQLLRYIVRVWERWRVDEPAGPLPLILPFVLHHGDRPWKGPMRLRDRLDRDGVPPALRLFLEPLSPDLGFLLDDLTRQSEDALESRKLSSLAHLSVLFMQHLRWAAPEGVPAAIHRWEKFVAAVLEQSGQHGLMLLWSYLFQTTEPDLRQVLSEVSPQLRRRLEESVMSTAERLRQEGLEEGRVEGRREMVLRLLERRFGALPESAVERVGAAKDADLDRWADALLTAATLDDVFG